MNNWKKELAKESARYDREYNREYKTDRGLWNNQSYGSLECAFVRENQLRESIAEYQRANEWN